MGIFDLFKKKKTTTDNKESSFVVNAGNGESVNVTFSGIQSAPAEHETWPKINGTTDNEYVNAVFLSIHKGKPHKEDSVAHLGWLSYKLGIHDPVRKYKDMLREGYFREARPDEILNTYRVAEIKDMLSAHGVEAAGKKADLIAALLEAVPVKKLDLPVLYRLSSKGWDYMEQHQDLIDLFRNPYQITYEEYTSVKNKAPSYMKFNDIIWSILNNRELTFGVNDFLGRRYNREYMAKFLLSEGKHASALVEYLTVIYFDMNDTIDTYMHIRNANNGRTDFKLTLPELKLPEYLVNQVYELREHYVSEMVSKSMRHAYLKRKCVSDSDFQAYLNDLFSKKTTDFSKYVKMV